MSGQQLLLHGEANPGSGLAHIRLDLTDVLNVSEKQNGAENIFMIYNMSESLNAS